MLSMCCEQCGDSFEVGNHRANTAKYCSLGCMGEAYKKRPAPKAPPKTANMVIVICKCGAPFTVSDTRFKHGRGKHCSPKCQYDSNSGIHDDTPVTKFNCLNCKTDFVLYTSLVLGSTKTPARKGLGKYCSRSCRDTHRCGKNHPGYISGSASYRRGPNWQAQRRAARARDSHQCQHCAMTTAESMIKFGQPLHVHHIRPYRLFDSYLEANKLENLLTLCMVCHRKEDAAFRRSEAAKPRTYRLTTKWASKITMHWPIGAFCI